MSKVVMTFKNNESILMEKRNEKDQVIGQRRVNLIDFAKTMLLELPTGAILDFLSNERLESYLKYEIDTYSSEEFKNFLTDILKYAPLDWLTSTEELHHLSKWSKEILYRKHILTQDALQFTQHIIESINETKESNIVLSDLALAVFNRMNKLHQFEDGQFVAQIVRLIGELIENINRKLETSIDFSENTAELDNKLRDYLYLMSLDTLKQVVRAREDDANRILQTFALPKNCAFVAAKTKGNSYVVEIPKQRLRVKYHNQAIENVGHPRLLFIFQEVDGQVQDMKLVAAKENEVIQADMSLYVYPFSNVYPGGRVCWNGYQERSIQDIWLISQEFLATSNNSHLVEKAYEKYCTYENVDFNDSELQPLNRRLSCLL